MRSKRSFSKEFKRSVVEEWATGQMGRLSYAVNMRSRRAYCIIGVASIAVGSMITS